MMKIIPKLQAQVKQFVAEEKAKVAAKKKAAAKASSVKNKTKSAANINMQTGATSKK